MANIVGNSTTEIDAPLDHVWEVVEDVEDAPNWQGGLKGLHALERDDEGRVILCEADNDAKVLTLPLRGPGAPELDAGEGAAQVRRRELGARGPGRWAHPGYLLARGRPRAQARDGDPRSPDRPAPRHARRGSRR
jgi:hypothetical protein